MNELNLLVDAIIPADGSAGAVELGLQAKLSDFTRSNLAGILQEMRVADFFKKPELTHREIILEEHLAGDRASGAIRQLVLELLSLFYASGPGQQSVGYVPPSATRRL